MSTTVTAGTAPATRADLLGTALLGVVGLVAVVIGSGYGFLVDGEVGPGFLPVATGGFIVLAVLAEIARMALGRRAQRRDGHTAHAVGDEQAADVEEETDVFGRDERQRTLATGAIFALVGAALLLSWVVGLLLALTALVFVVLLVVERKPVLASAVGAGACLVLAWVIFDLLLATPLPRGLLGVL